MFAQVYKMSTNLKYVYFEPQPMGYTSFRRQRSVDEHGVLKSPNWIYREMDNGKDYRVLIYNG